MKRLLVIVGVGFTLVFSSGAAFAGDVIIDIPTKASEQDLEILIPDDLEPGFHELEVEVYDDTGAVTTQVISFCKNADGEILWDNSCTEADLMSATYDPREHVGEVLGSMVALFALLALGAGRGKGAAEEEREQGSIASADSGQLHRHDRDQRWGDRSWTWRAPLQHLSDRLSIALPLFFARITPGLGRSAADGSYLRAITGSLALLFFPVAIAIGVIAAAQPREVMLPSGWFWLAALLVVGIIDAGAGLLAGLAFVITSVLLRQVQGLGGVMVTLGVLAVVFTPALLASTIRPLRRHLDSARDRWERIVDYALILLLGGWGISSLIGAFNGLAGRELDVTTFAKPLGVLAAIAFALRLFAEDLAQHFYPQRLQVTSPDLPAPTRRQAVVALFNKALVFWILTVQFVGPSVHVWLATLVMVLPGVIGMTMGSRLPRSELLAHVLPSATLKVVVLTIIGGYLSVVVESGFAPGEALRWGLVLLAIPGCLHSVMNHFGRDPETHWTERRYGWGAYVLGGVLVYMLLVAHITGVALHTFLPMWTAVIAAFGFLVVAGSKFGPRVERA